MTVTNQPTTSLLGLRDHDDKLTKLDEFSIPAFKKKQSENKPPPPKINSFMPIVEETRERNEGEPFSIPPFSRKMKSDKEL